MNVTMIWGMFPFSAKTAPYETIKKSSSWEFGKNKRVGQWANYQYLGRGEETIELTGKLLPMVTGGRRILELLKKQADLTAEAGKGLPLIEKTGIIHGVYVLTNVDEVMKYFEGNGAPNLIEFTMKFERIGNDVIDSASLLSSIGGMIG